jgi:hypothetical protein
VVRVVRGACWRHWMVPAFDLYGVDMRIRMYCEAQCSFRRFARINYKAMLSEEV